MFAYKKISIKNDQLIKIKNNYYYTASTFFIRSSFLNNENEVAKRYKLVNFIYFVLIVQLIKYFIDDFSIF